MGSGIALVALYAGCEVYLQDTYPQVLNKAAEYVKKFLEKKDQGSSFKKLHLVNKLEELAAAQIIIEAAPEQLTLKQELFQQLDAICPPPAILASNTSTLSVTAIAAATQHPERVAGLHFFNPAAVLPLVEVVKAAGSSAETMASLVALVEALGKTPVVTGDTPGFIVNRVARPYYGEALRLLGEGVASYEQIDQIAEMGGGFRMGPFRLMDLIGIDVNTAAMQSLYAQTFGEPRYRPHWLQMQKVAEGALGRKSGRGFYEYKDEAGGMKHENSKADIGGGSGRILISEGTWAPGLAELCAQAGYEIDSVPDAEQHPVACFVAAGRSEEAARLAAWYDQSLPPEVPLFIQSSDLTLSEAAIWVQHKQRLIGFDGLFLASGHVATLVSAESAAQDQAETIMVTLGKSTVWIKETPGLVLPRIVCQLANEAAFAMGEGVAEAGTIDLAMRLGTNYPLGPLEWGQTLGWPRVLAVLDHLREETGEARYRAAPWLRRKARMPKA